MASTVWKGNISLGLVSFPVKMSVAARGEGISFNMLHTTCKGRIKQSMECPTCAKTITRADTVKGYEVSKDKYVTVTPEELEACEPESSKIMEITETVPASEVDPLLFDSSYYFEPELAGRKGYQLIHAALKAEGRYAIAKATMSGREHTVVIRPVENILVMHTMFYQDEIRSQPSVEFDSKVSSAELKLARQLVAMNAESFEHKKYRDEYTVKVGEMLEAKANGKVIATPTVKKREPVVDIMAALEASLRKPTKRKAA